MKGRQGHFSFCQVLCRSATCWRVIKLLLTRSWRNADFLIALLLGTGCCLFWSLKKKENVIVILKSASFKRRRAVWEGSGTRWSEMGLERTLERWILHVSAQSMGVLSFASVERVFLCHLCKAVTLVSCWETWWGLWMEPQPQHYATVDSIDS